MDKPHLRGVVGGTLDSPALVDFPHRGSMASLFQVWSETVRREPDAPALVDAGSGRAWTRRELAQEGATWLAEHSGAVHPGERVLIVEPNGIGWWRAFLGLAEAGAVPVPIDPSEPLERQQSLALALGARGIVHRGEWRAGATRAARSRPEIALVKLTSGSTGQPRALPFHHGHMLADGRQVCSSMGIRPDDVNLAVIPLGHSYGLGNLTLPLLIQGTTLVCASSPLPQSLAQDCVRFRPTVFPSVPPLLQALVRSDVPVEALASLRLVISAGARLPAELAAAFAEKFSRRVHGFYGSSETGGISFDRTGDASLTGRSVGTPMDGVTIHAGGDGRITVSSAAVGGRGRFRPADRVELNAHGELVLLGRTGRMVKLGARRVDLAEIEAALRQLPGVRDAFAMPHPDRPESLAAAVAMSEPVAPGALRDQLVTRLPAWKIPHRLLALADFPTTARGKTDVRQLQARLARP